MANSTEIKLIAQAHAQQFNKQQNDYYLQMANNMIAENQQNEKYLQMANDMIANQNKVSQPVQTQNVQPVETQPVQQKTVNEVKQIPSIADFGKDQDNKTYIQNVIENNILRQQEVGKPYGPMIEEARAQKQNEPSKEQNIEDSLKEIARIKNISVDEARRLYEQGPSEEAITSPGTSVLNYKAADELADNEKIQKYLDVNKRLTDSEKEDARNIAQQVLEKYNYRSGNIPVLNSEEDRKRYADAVNLLNKTSPVANFSQSFLSPYTNLARSVRDSLNVMANQSQEGAAKVTDALGITKNAKEKAAESIENRQKAIDSVDQSTNTATDNASVQNPLLSGAGNLLGNMSQYYLSGPLFDALGGAAGLGKAGKFLLNQVGQAGQDVILDVLPEYKKMMEDGQITEEEKQDLGNRFGGDVLANLTMASLPALNNASFDYLTQTVGKNADVLKAMDASGALKNIPDVIREVGDATKQIPGIDNITDIYKGVDNYSVDNAKSVDNAIENVAKKSQIELPKETQEQLLSDFEEYYRALDTMDEAAQKSGNAKAIEKFDNLKKAVFDYEEAVWKSDDPAAINAAKKKADSTRQAFVREMKKIDPNYKGELTGTKLGRAEFRRTSLPQSDEALEAITELENLGNDVSKDVVKQADNIAESVSKSADNFSIESVNGKNGQPVYYIALKNGDMTVPVEPGKTYKSAEEAKNALDMNLQHFAEQPKQGDFFDGVNEPNWKVSEAYTNTGKRGGGWTADEYAKHTKEHNFLYESIDEARSIEEATKMRATEGRQAFKNRALYSDRLSSVELDGLMMEWRDLTREARELEAAGKRADTKWIDANKIFRKIQEESTNNAQALQALAKWSRNTPEGLLVQAENIINGKIKVPETALQKALAKYSKKQKIQFSDDFMKKFLDTAKPLDGLSGDQLDTREAKDIMAKLGKMVNEQLPVRLNEKLQTYLMNNMLGNIRTLITRNAGGNVGLNAIEQTLERPLAAGIDSLVSLKTGKRTQAGLSKQGIVDYLSGFKKGLADEVTDFKLDVHTARSGENTLANAINSNRRIFKNKLMNFGDKLVRHGLSVGDRPFYEAVYKQTIGDYNTLYNKGLMGQTVQTLSPEEFKTYSEVAAKLNALGAVYQQDTVLSNALMGFKKDIGMLSEGTIGVDILSQFSMPFVKTPANVIERAIDYSPLGIVRNAFRTGKELKSGVFDQNRFANETARNILGTTLMGGGAALAANGVMSGSYSDNANQKQAQKESGMQEYAWNVPEQIPGIGGKQMDISWAPVIGSNLVASAAAVDAYNKGKGDTVGNLATGLKAGGQALFDQAMFQGLQRLFGSGESYNSDEGIVANMSNVVKSGIGQGIPSLARQIAQVSDKYQRDLSGSNKDTSFGPMGNYDINSLANNIPKLREEYLAPKVNTSGELMMENQGRGLGMKILEDMILPGKLTEIQANKLTEEANRLSEITTNATAYIPKADRSVLDTEDHVLTNDEWVNYQQKYYKELNSAGEQLIDSDYYKGLDDATKETTLSNVYSAIRTAINSEYTGKEVDGASKKYIEAGGGEDGINAVLNYYTAKNLSNEAGLNASSNAAKEIQKDIESGNLEAAEQKKDAAIRLPELGLDKPGPISTYYNAQEQIPGLTVEDFATTYKAIDTDKNQGIKQDEVIDYLNKNKITSQSEANEIWSAYGNSEWKNIPSIKDGVWTKKKK